MESDTGHEVVISDGVAVLEEDAIVRDFLLGRRHVGLFLNALLEPLNRVAKGDVDGKHLSVQLPFRFVGDIRDLDLQ